MDAYKEIISFSDITLNEKDGIYKDIKEIMEKEPPYCEKWVLRSDITIVSSSGICQMEVQFHDDKSIYILNYTPSIGDLFYNPDLQIFSQWCQKKGWNIPQPHPDLVKQHKEFWKHFYDTLIIDSDYLDKIYGKRSQLDID